CATLLCWESDNDVKSRLLVFLLSLPHEDPAWLPFARALVTSDGLPPLIERSGHSLWWQQVFVLLNRLVLVPEARALLVEAALIERLFAIYATVETPTEQRRTALLHLLKRLLEFDSTNNVG